MPLVKHELHDKPVPKRNLSDFQSVSSRVSQKKSSANRRPRALAHYMEPSSFSSSQRWQPERPMLALSASVHGSIRTMSSRNSKLPATEMALSHMISKSHTDYYAAYSNVLKHSSVIHSPNMLSRTFGDQNDLKKTDSDSTRLDKRIDYDSGSSESLISIRQSPPFGEAFHRQEGNGP